MTPTLLLVDTNLALCEAWQCACTDLAHVAAVRRRAPERVGHLIDREEPGFVAYDMVTGTAR